MMIIINHHSGHRPGHRTGHRPDLLIATLALGRPR